MTTTTADTTVTTQVHRLYIKASPEAIWDAITRPEQVPTNGQVAPDQSSMNPYTSDAGTGNAQTAPESVQPVYSRQPTQGNDSSSIPIGLRDLVKDYFSSLDQK